MPPLSLREYAPRRRFSCTVSAGNTSRPSGERLMPCSTIRKAGTLVMFFPLKVMAPVWDFTRPVIAESVVDLPAPLEPISVTISPSLTSIWMPLRA